MASVKSLLIRTVVETAAGSRKCHRNPKNHAIATGDVCLVVINDMGGKRNYCVTCAGEMLTKAHANIEVLKAQLLDQSGN